MLTPERSFYINFKLLNVGEAFPRIMRAKVRGSGKGGAAVRIAGEGGRLIASNPKFGKVFSNKIADTLANVMPVQMLEKGIQLGLTKVHCGDMGFVVLRAEVLDVDLMRLLETAKGTEFAAKVAPLIGMARRLKDIDRSVLPRLQQQLMGKMEGMLPTMMKEKAGLNLLVITKPSSQQADFFFDALAPHHFELEFRVLNRVEAISKLASARAQNKFGPAPLLGKAAGAVASCATRYIPNEVFSKMVARRIRGYLPEFMAEAGVTLVVTETFVSADHSGGTVVRCEASDVDLAALRAAGAKLPTLAADQHFFRLGHQGRQQVYQAVRDLAAVKLPAKALARKGLQVEVVARDVQKEPAQMLDMDALSDSEHDED